MNSLKSKNYSLKAYPPRRPKGLKGESIEINPPLELWAQVLWDQPHLTIHYLLTHDFHEETWDGGQNPGDHQNPNGAQNLPEAPSRIWFPPKNPLPQFRDDLWKSTCFELFLKEPQSSRYWEWNFSPSEDWAQYEFSSYRRREEVHLSRPLLEPQIKRLAVNTAVNTMDTVDTTTIALNRMSTVHAVGIERVEQHIQVILDFSPWPPLRSPLQMGLSAILLMGEDLSYWALAHPDENRPDFHNPNSFAERINLDTGLQSK